MEQTRVDEVRRQAAACLPYVSPIMAVQRCLDTAGETVEWIRGNGTVSFVDTGQKRLLITGDHVYGDLHVFRLEGGDISLQLSVGSKRPPQDVTELAPLQRGDRERMDMVAAYPPDELIDVLAQGNKRFLRVPIWPPPRPSEGDKCFVVGFPYSLISPRFTHAYARLCYVDGVVGGVGDPIFAVRAPDGGRVVVRYVTDDEPTEFSIKGISGGMCFRQDGANLSYCGIVSWAADPTRPDTCLRVVNADLLDQDGSYTELARRCLKRP